MIVDEYKIDCTIIKIHNADIIHEERRDLEKNAICNLFKKIKNRYRS